MIPCSPCAIALYKAQKAKDLAYLLPKSAGRQRIFSKIAYAYTYIILNTHGRALMQPRHTLRAFANVWQQVIDSCLFLTCARHGNTAVGAVFLCHFIYSQIFRGAHAAASDASFEFPEGKRRYFRPDVDTISLASCFSSI